MLHVLTWLGLKNDQKSERQFFAGVKKKTIFLILLLALTILNGVKWVMSELIPTAFFSDPVVSVIPGVLGVLTAVVFVLLMERFMQDKSSEK
ncbi:hypothetical protein [Exiguobacterium acetylicum]|uniref:hypothetical protein n=1 Tax=Exiguobacterium acetylicum TaxID=41170 RepID=UPI001EE17F4C|nr:hypothetical protein [Exiguobacterium acetylicum]UKS57352.1 hypothetical protein K6T22_07000 [Exiguobacterium acetylicum]